jgi:hypothetical protein
MAQQNASSLFMLRQTCCCVIAADSLDGSSDRDLMNALPLQRATAAHLPPDSMGRGSAAAARFGRLAAAASASRWRSCTSTLHPMLATTAIRALPDVNGGRDVTAHAQVHDSRHFNALATNGAVHWRPASSEVLI